MASPLKSSHYVRYGLYVLAGALVLWLLQTSGGPSKGGGAPGFDLPVVAANSPGGRVSLEERDGKPVLIEVFASWCGSCRKSAPVLARAHEKYGSRLEFVGVSVDDNRDAAVRAKESWHIPYTVAYDDRGAFARAYKIRVLPTFVLVDREGRIQKVSAGTLSPGTLDEWAESVLQ